MSVAEPGELGVTTTGSAGRAAPVRTGPGPAASHPCRAALNVYGHCIPGTDRDADRSISNFISVPSTGIEGGGLRFQPRAWALRYHPSGV
jgi:hypothetical protein